MRKKLLICTICFMISLVIVGCGNVNITPSEKVEEYMKKYQDMDSDVLTQLDQTISEDDTMTDKEKEDYRALMEKQYQNLSYKINNESINGNTATVDVEVEVYDYASSITKSEKYRDDNADLFAEKDDKSGDELFNDYKIKELKDVTDTKKETIIFNLTKEDNEWKVTNLEDDDISKIHGLYNK